jgi:sec-independent protein translocase protein TatC
MGGKPIVSAMREIARKLPPDQQALAGRFVFHGFAEPFLLRLQISLYAGVVLALPFIVLEVWGFVAPGLTSNERKPMQFIAPFSVLLFGMGAGLAFFIMPAAVHWFLGYLPDFPDAILLQDPQDYILFVVKMMLVFGIVFQLPIIMMGLGKLGILRSAFLVKYWRYAVVAITVVAMVVTPSNDPFSMIVMAVPLVILFFISIFLVRLVEPREA